MKVKNPAMDFTKESRSSVLLYSSVIGSSSRRTDVTLDDFEIILQLGKGAFGKVYLSKFKENGDYYAIKAIRKDVLIEKEQIESVKLERDILLSTKHPFLCSMDFVFQNELRIYFVMPYIKGGDLYQHFFKCKRFPEEMVKFYISQIALAIGHLHSKNIIH